MADLRDIPLDVLEAEVARRRAELDADDACPGAGQCHGCAGWCDRCGDVALVCDSPTCDRHHCDCGDRAVIVDEGLGYCGIWSSPKWHSHIRGDDMGFCRREGLDPRDAEYYPGRDVTEERRRG